MTQKIQASFAMISAVKAVRPNQRLAAAKVAEMAYFTALDRLTRFDDFGDAENRRLAEEAAVAEISYQFGKR